MKKIFSKFTAMLGMILAQGNAPRYIGTEEFAPSPILTKSYKGFVRGDKFYNHLSFKRVKGKWKVKR